MRGGDCGAGPGGVYIHVPFCVKRCAYCSFYSTTNAGLINSYVDALKKEIALKSDAMPAGFAADTLYFGGGTPSLLNPRQVGEIIALARVKLPFLPDTEITLEVNPATADFTKLNDFALAGVNRLSIGMQSFNDANLKMLGRAHSVKDALRVFDDARRAGFGNISIDLIYGLPGQNLAQLEADIARAAALNPEHISAYMLTVEVGTPLGRSLASGALPALNEETQRQAFDLVAERLSAYGYAQYEISNFYRLNTSIDYRSRHNLKYWNFASYMGLGPSAHAYNAPRTRFWNTTGLLDYIKRLEQGQSPEEGREVLTNEQILMEMVYLGLRQTKGMDISLFDKYSQTGFAVVCARPLQKLQQQGLLKVKNGYCLLTKSGRPLLDYITGLLVNAL